MKDLACQENGNANKPLKVAVTGSSGLIGSALVASLSACGHSVIKLVRNELNANGEDVLYWNPTTGAAALFHAHAITRFRRCYRPSTSTV